MNHHIEWKTLCSLLRDLLSKGCDLSTSHPAHSVANAGVLANTAIPIAPTARTMCRPGILVSKRGRRYTTLRRYLMCVCRPAKFVRAGPAQAIMVNAG